MLSILRTRSPEYNNSLPVSPMTAGENRYNRNLEEDMKKAISLVFTLTSELEKLHPDCLTIVEKLVSLPRGY